MLSNYYPIHIKSIPANRLSRISRLKKVIKTLVETYSKRSARHSKRQQGMAYHNHLGQWAEQFNRHLVGQTAAITTDTNAIRIQQFGKLGRIRLYGDLGLLQGGDINVYLYTDNWRSIHYQKHQEPSSLICFDDSHDQAWGLSCPSLKLELANQHLRLSLPEPHPPAPQKASTKVDINELRQMWASLTQVHQFYDMLSLFKLDLLEAITLMQDQWTHPITSSQLTNFLQQCFEHKLNCKIMAGNRGIVHELNAPIKLLQLAPETLTINGDNYRCEVNLLSIKQAWLVKRATKRGIAHSLEAFDDHGRLILQIQEQKPSDQPESSLWMRCLGRQGIISLP